LELAKAVPPESQYPLTDVDAEPTEMLFMKLGSNVPPARDGVALK
jgi:hypothetical protein